MDCGIPFCNNGCPVNNIIPDFNDLGVPSGLEDRDRSAALHEQLPGIHGPHLPGAVRSSVHARHQRRSGRHQVARTRDHRQGVGRRLGRAAAAEAQDRQEGRRGRFRALRARRRAATRARGPRGDRVREERPHRRPAALRHSRLQAGEVADRPPHAPDGSGRRDVPRQRVRRQARFAAAVHRQHGEGNHHARAVEAKTSTRS